MKKSTPRGRTLLCATRARTKFYAVFQRERPACKFCDRAKFAGEFIINLLLYTIMCYG